MLNDQLYKFYNLDFRILMTSHENGLLMFFRYDVRRPFRTQTLFSWSWLSKHRILACSSFYISGNTYLLQLCYSLFESPQDGEFDDQITNFDVIHTLKWLILVLDHKKRVILLDITNDRHMCTMLSNQHAYNSKCLL